MPILDIQRRGQQIGRIRIGHLISTDSGKTRPAKLAEFRFTTASRVSADAIAQLYGGEVRDWQRGQFEVYTRQSAIGVTVPPRDQVISQWYEMWSKGGAQRRCDSQHEQIGDGPCLCPHAEDPDDEEEVARCALERAGLAKANPPRACKLVTRISVMIPDLPGLGVFRLDSGSYYAASEIGDAALLMQAARDKGVLLPAVLRIEQRQRIAGGKTTNYPVPVLEVLATFRQIATGALEAGGIMAQLPPAPGEQPKAITAGPAAVPAPPADAGPEIEPMDWQRAQVIYERALAAASGSALTACANEAKAAGLLDEHVCTDSQADVWEPLHDALQAIWREKAKEAS
jgi:Recombination directionality factor-like